MAKLDLSPLREISGFIGASLVDSDSGLMLGKEGGASVDLDIASAGNTEVVRAKRNTMKALKISDKIEEFLISTTQQYHLIRPLDSNDALFIYIALDRARANLGMARLELKKFEQTLDFS